MRLRAREKLKGFFLVPKSHQHARAYLSSAVSHIPQSGDATASPAGDAASPTGDVDVSAGDVHL